MAFQPGEPNDLDSLKARYRTLSGVRHPDKGGTDAAMAELNSAYDQARREIAS